MSTRKFLELQGNTNDLLTCEGCLKMTRLFDFTNYDHDGKDEIIDLTIGSSSIKGEHTKFDELLDRKIRITVDIIDD